MPDPNITLAQLFSSDQEHFPNSRQLLYNVVEAVMLESGSNFPDALDRVHEAADWARSGGNPTLGGLLSSLGRDAETKVTESLKLLDQQAEDTLAPLTDAQREAVGPQGVERDKKARKRLKRLDMPATESTYRWALEQEVTGVPMPPKKSETPGAVGQPMQQTLTSLAHSSGIHERVVARMKELNAPDSAYPQVLGRILSGEG